MTSACRFGSRARGTAHRDRDVDVAVLLDREALPEQSDRSRAAVALAARRRFFAIDGTPTRVAGRPGRRDTGSL